VHSLPKTVTRQRRDCDLNPGPSALESSTLTTQLPSHPYFIYYYKQQRAIRPLTRCNSQQCIHDTVFVLRKIIFAIFQQIIVVQRSTKFSETIKISTNW